MSRGTNQDDKLSTFILSSSRNFTSFLNVSLKFLKPTLMCGFHTAVLGKNYPPDDLLIRQ